MTDRKVWVNTLCSALMLHSCLCTVVQRGTSKSNSTNNMKCCRHWNQTICCIPSHCNRFRWGPQINRASGCRCKPILLTLFCSFWNLIHTRPSLFHTRKITLCLLPFCLPSILYNLPILLSIIPAFSGKVYQHLSILTQYSVYLCNTIFQETGSYWKKLNINLPRQRSTCKPNNRNYFKIPQVVKIINITIWN